MLILLEMDFIKNLVNILMAIIKSNDKIERIKELTSDDVELSSVTSEESEGDEPETSLSQRLPKEPLKFQASMQNFRVALVEDAWKDNPTALVLRVS